MTRPEAAPLPGVQTPIGEPETDQDINPSSPVCTEQDTGTEQDEWRLKCTDSKRIEARAVEQFQTILEFIRQESKNPTSFAELEQSVIPLLFALGRLLLAVFLCLCHQELATPSSQTLEGRSYQRRDPRARLLGTFFGKVRYWRTYMYAQGGGYYPLDLELKLPVDGFSFHLSSLMARLATKISYAQTTLVLRCILGWSPSHTTVEHTVFGLARHTSAYFEQAPVPVGDGEVLIVMIDSKATPTATEEELQKRRGKREPAQVPGSPRHRGRQKRERRGRKERRKKGDKSKNGKMATLVVIYTLQPDLDREGKSVLKGPINRRIYASYAPKRYAFAVARREAERRGFTPESGKIVQLVTDGDQDLSRYAEEYFPQAIHTLDIIHAIEYLWSAGHCLHREGSDELEEWVDKQRSRLYDSEIRAIVQELKQALGQVPKTGPGNKGKRKRLQEVINYLAKRVSMMNYDELIEKDLEISSGAVEGAVKYVIAQRFDEGGMRWIKEGSEALLQLRCIEVNDQWDDFIKFVHATGRPGCATAPPQGVSLQASTPGPLPSYGLEA